MSTEIIVVGSSNTDMVIQSSSLPSPGETVLGNDLVVNAGGKGANQAVAAARLGGKVSFVAKVGTDSFGDDAVAEFKKNGIETRFVFQDPDRPSGVALIMVDKKGENCISVSLGANSSLSPEDVEVALSSIGRAGYLLIQLETPLATVAHTVSLASTYNIPVILNPAPAAVLPDDVLQNIHLITPNQVEAALLTGISISSIPDAQAAAEALHKKGVKNVVITLGKKGAYVFGPGIDEHVPGVHANVVDTTAAGDTFNGALAVGLAEGQSLIDAVKFANRAAALSVSRLGAQQSVPWREELDAIIKTD